MDSMMIPTSQGKNSLIRYNAIKNVLGDIKGKSLVDIGCENGYFSAKFLNDGGGSAVGVEPNEQCRKLCDSINIPNFNVVDNIDKVNGRFDFCFYLSLHYHEGIDYLPWIKKHCSVVFAETSGNPKISDSRNYLFQKELQEYFLNVEEVCFTPYANRKVFKCY